MVRIILAMVEGGGRASFVGRAREMARLDAAFEDALDGHGRIVLCDGEAGIGKTRLIGEFASRTRERGGAVLVGGCVELRTGGLPFGPFVEAFRSGISTGVIDRAAIRPSSVRELGRLLPDLDERSIERPADDVDRDAFAQVRLFEAFYGTLASVADERPCLLVLEDLHWGDASTYGLLGFLVRNVEHQRILLVGTHRTHAIARGDPSAHWLTELARRPGVERWQVAPFERAETAAAIASILGHEPEPDVVDAIHARSDGNPFVVEELTAAARDGDAANIPPTLHEIILARLASLGQSAQAVAGAAAVVGRTIDEPLLATLTGLSSSELEIGLRELVAHDILAPAASPDRDHFAFRHALTQEVAYLDLLPGERHRLHGACADALEARQSGGGGADAVVFAIIAHHRDLAGDPALTLRAMLGAADTANSVFAFADALHDLERALELWDIVPPDRRPPGDRAALLDAAAAAAGLAGDAERSAELTRRALEALGTAGDRGRRGRLLARLSDATMFSGDPARLDVTREAATLLADEPPSAERVRALTNLGAELAWSQQQADAVRSLREAIAASDAADPEALDIVAAGAQARTTLAGLMPSMPVGEIIGIATASVASNEAGGRPQDVAYAYMDLSSWLLGLGRFEESLAIARRGIAEGDGRGYAQALGPMLVGNACDALLYLGRWDEAEAMARPLIDCGSSAAVFLRGEMAAIALGRGDVEGARRWIAAMPEPDVDQGSHELALLTRWSQADVALVSGELDRVREIVEPAFTAHIWHTMAASPWAGTLRVAIAGEVEVAARARVRRSGPALLVACERVERALARLDAYAQTLAPGHGEFEAFRATAHAEASRMDGIGAHEAWGGAGDRWRSIGAVYWAAYCDYRRAEAALGDRQVDRNDTRRWLRGAAATAQRLGAAWLGAEVRGLARRARVELVVPDEDGARTGSDVSETRRVGRASNDLTERELEILALLATGMTNRQIGERLFISPKTAGVHVSNILGKLDVGGRVEAATMAHRMGLIVVDRPSDGA